MSKTKAGRPIDPKAITKAGKSHTFWVTQVDEQMIKALMKIKEMGFTELMRHLIHEAMKGH